AQDESRRPREEATTYLSDARQEADQLRAQARRTLEEARDEVAILLRRRDEITAELGQLSGVIQALAVPAVVEQSDHRTGPPIPSPRDVSRAEESARVEEDSRND